MASRAHCCIVGNQGALGGGIPELVGSVISSDQLDDLCECL